MAFSIIVMVAFCTPALAYDWSTNPGNGLPENPYQISEPNHLMAIGSDAALLDKHFILTNDIVFNPNNNPAHVFSTALIAPDTDIYRAWYTGTPFSGYFDGNGHVVRNLKIIQTTPYIDHVGLFGEINGGIVEDLGVENLTITLEDDSRTAGGLAATNGGIIRNCYTTGTIKEGVSSLGGLVGYHESSGLIIDSYSTCYVRGRYDCERVGGLVGLSNGRVERCYATGVVWGDHGALTVGGLVGGNNGDIVYCYATGIVVGLSSSYNVGGLAGRNGGGIYYSYSSGMLDGSSTTHNIGGFVGLNSGTIENSYTSARISPSGLTPSYVGQFVANNTISGIISNCLWDSSVWGIGHGISVNSGIIVNLEGHPTESMHQQITYTDGPFHWDFVGEYINGSSGNWSMPEESGYPIHWWQLDPWPELPVFSGGSGSSEDPYLISDCNDLNLICQNSRLMDQSFKLLNDIDCNDVNVFSVGSVPFPFSGTFDGGFHVLRNINLESESSEGVGYFPCLGADGIIENLGLENISIQAGSCQCVGALVGISYGNIKRCFVEGTLVVGDDSDYVGGLAGLNKGMITYSFASMDISAGDSASDLGGFVGRNWSTIQDCYSCGSVSNGIDGRSIGGFIGQYIAVTNDLDRCFSWTVVTPGLSALYVGGFIGRHHESIFQETSSCFWDVEVSTMTDGIGNLEPDPAEVMGRTTVGMQTLSTFTSEGWDFLGESANGDNVIWRMCVNGLDYPRLSWEFAKNGDFACGDGVDILDLQALASNWLMLESDAPLLFNYACDANGDGQIDLEDYSVLSGNW